MAGAVALFPLAKGKPVFRRTQLDLGFGIFLVTMMLAVWPSYDLDRSMAKFWVLAGALLLYYTVAAQPRVNLWFICVGVSAFAVFVALHFLLTHDWFASPADFGLLNRVGALLMSLRPEAVARRVHPNVVGGILAVLTPFTLILVRYGWQQKRWGRLFFGASACGLVLFALVLTSSRAAWAALAAAMASWLLWKLSVSLGPSLGLHRRTMFRVALVVGFSGAALIALTQLPRIYSAVARVPGSNTAPSRLEVYQNTANLLADFVFTGGGLASFPGLYSEYILTIPVGFLDYAHNLYFDLLLEQGAAGLASFLAIMAISSLFLIRGTAKRKMIPKHSSLRWASLAALIVMLLHGFLDDSLYGLEGTSLLFLLPGISVVLSASRQRPAPEFVIPGEENRYPSSPANPAALVLTGGLFGSLFLLSVVVLHSNLSFVSAWYANIGAVRMSRVDLAGWPSGDWDLGENGVALDEPQRLFQRALAFDPNNETANYRLGLISMRRHDFEGAVPFLETALWLDSAHPGIRRNLAFSYVWSADYESAADLLLTLPDAQRDLEVYNRWWRTQNRDDLSARAAEMLKVLQGLGQQASSTETGNR